jgi:hypothetical protein
VEELQRLQAERAAGEEAAAQLYLKTQEMQAELAQLESTLAGHGKECDTVRKQIAKLRNAEVRLSHFFFLFDLRLCPNTVCVICLRLCVCATDGALCAAGRAGQDSARGPRQGGALARQAAGNDAGSRRRRRVRTHWLRSAVGSYLV